MNNPVIREYAIEFLVKRSASGNFFRVLQENKKHVLEQCKTYLWSMDLYLVEHDVPKTLSCYKVAFVCDPAMCFSVQYQLKRMYNDFMCD
jgi:hypothetical protein